MGTRNLTMVINQEGEKKVAQYGQWDRYTVHIYESNFGICEEESWENAKLIAKAPELLKMLKKVTDELEYYAGNTILKNPLIEKSRNLIKTI